MLRTFNCGLGMILAVAAENAAAALDTLVNSGEEPVVVGEIVPGEAGVTFSGALAPEQ